MSIASSEQVISGWSESSAKSKRAAAKLALELVRQKPGTLVASKEKIATELGVHESTAQRARLLLLGAGIVYKSGRHMYVSSTSE
jgi:DNA-binding transcriptional regulator YhcF (GntR family)